MKLNIIATLLIGSSLVLTACGGSGGGGSNSAAVSSEIGTVTSLQMLNNDPTEVVGGELLANDDAITFDEDGILRVNGVEPEKWTAGQIGAIEEGFANGAVFGTYYSNGELRAFGDYFNELGDDIAEFIADDTTYWTWSNVNYLYFIGGMGTDAVEFAGADGSIDFENNEWTASFGDVELSGVVGNEGIVSGTATLGDMSGEFDGFDGVVIFDGQEYFVTNGAFAGDNGNDSVFAGGWNQNW